MKRAGSAVELRPAPKARSAAHPQERQHSAAEGGTRDRVRPAGALHTRRLRHAHVSNRHPNGRRRGQRSWPITEESARLRAPAPGPATQIVGPLGLSSTTPSTCGMTSPAPTLCRGSLYGHFVIHDHARLSHSFTAKTLAQNLRLIADRSGSVSSASLNRFARSQIVLKSERS